MNPNELANKLYIIATTEFAAYSDEVEILTQAGNLILSLSSQNDALVRKFKAVNALMRGG